MPRLPCVRPWTSAFPPLRGLSAKKLSCARPCFLVIFYHRSRRSPQLPGVYKHLLVSPAAWWVLSTQRWWRVQWICPLLPEGWDSAIPTCRILDRVPRVAHTGAHSLPDVGGTWASSLENFLCGWEGRGLSETALGLGLYKSHFEIEELVDLYFSGVCQSGS